MAHPHTPEPFFVVRPSAREITSIKFIPGNNGSDELLSYGDAEGQLGIIDLKTMRVGWSWSTTSKKSVLSVDVCGLDNIISLCKESVAEVWDLSKQVKIVGIPLDTYSFCKFSILKQKGEWSFAIGGSEFGQVQIYSKGDKKPSLVLRSDSSKDLGTCMAVYYSQVDGRYNQVLAGFESGSLIRWDTRNPHKYLSSLQLYDEPITCMDFSESAFGVAGSPGKVLKSFSCDPEGNLQLHHELVLKNAGQNDVSIRTDGKIFVTGGWDSRLRLFTCKKLKPLAVLQYHTESITSVDFCPGSSSSFSNVLAAASNDRKISLWRIY